MSKGLIGAGFFKLLEIFSEKEIIFFNSLLFISSKLTWSSIALKKILHSIFPRATFPEIISLIFDSYTLN